MKSELQNISEIRFRVIKISFGIDFESYLENTEFLYKSVESNTEFWNFWTRDRVFLQCVLAENEEKIGV